MILFWASEKSYIPKGILGFTSSLNDFRLKSPRLSFTKPKDFLLLRSSKSGVKNKSPFGHICFREPFSPPCTPLIVPQIIDIRIPETPAFIQARRKSLQIPVFRDMKSHACFERGSRMRSDMMVFIRRKGIVKLNLI